MALPTFTMRQMLEAGVHFGHVTRRWDPKMEKFIFGTRQGIHILDLQQTVPMMYRAMQAVNEAVAEGGRVLWVGTKRQAGQPVADAAKRCGRWHELAAFKLRARDFFFSSLKSRAGRDGKFKN